MMNLGKDLNENKLVKVTGQLRSYNKNIDNKNLESSPHFCYSKNSLIHKGEGGEAFYVSQTICRI